MSKSKPNKSIDFSVDDMNCDEILNNISSRNSINTSGSLNLDSLENYHMPLLEMDEIMKKREFLNKVTGRRSTLRPNFHVNNAIIKEILNKVFTNSIRVVNELKEVLNNQNKEAETKPILHKLSAFNEKHKLIEENKVFFEINKMKNISKSPVIINTRMKKNRSNKKANKGNKKGSDKKMKEKKLLSKEKGVNKEINKSQCEKHNDWFLNTESNMDNDNKIDKLKNEIHFNTPNSLNIQSCKKPTTYISLNNLASLEINYVNKILHSEIQKDTKNMDTEKDISSKENYETNNINPNSGNPNIDSIENQITYNNNEEKDNFKTIESSGRILTAGDNVIVSKFPDFIESNVNKNEHMKIDDYNIIDDKVVDTKEEDKIEEENNGLVKQKELKSHSSNYDSHENIINQEIKERILDYNTYPLTNTNGTNDIQIVDTSPNEIQDYLVKESTPSSYVNKTNANNAIPLSELDEVNENANVNDINSYYTNTIDKIRNSDEDKANDNPNIPLIRMFKTSEDPSLLNTEENKKEVNPIDSNNDSNEVSHNPDVLINQVGKIENIPYISSIGMDKADVTPDVLNINVDQSGLNSYLPNSDIEKEKKSELDIPNNKESKTSIKPELPITEIESNNENHDLLNNIIEKCNIYPEIPYSDKDQKLLNEYSQITDQNQSKINEASNKTDLCKLNENPEISIKKDLISDEVKLYIPSFNEEIKTNFNNDLTITDLNQKSALPSIPDKNLEENSKKLDLVDTFVNANNTNNDLLGAENDKTKVNSDNLLKDKDKTDIIQVFSEKEITLINPVVEIVKKAKEENKVSSKIETNILSKEINENMEVKGYAEDKLVVSKMIKGKKCYESSNKMIENEKENEIINNNKFHNMNDMKKSTEIYGSQVSLIINDSKISQIEINKDNPIKNTEQVADSKKTENDFIQYNDEKSKTNKRNSTPKDVKISLTKNNKYFNNNLKEKRENDMNNLLNNSYIFDNKSNLEIIKRKSDSFVQKTEEGDQNGEKLIYQKMNEVTAVNSNDANKDIKIDVITELDKDANSRKQINSKHSLINTNSSIQTNNLYYEDMEISKKNKPIKTELENMKDLSNCEPKRIEISNTPNDSKDLKLKLNIQNQVKSENQGRNEDKSGLFNKNNNEKPSGSAFDTINTNHPMIIKHKLFEEIKQNQSNKKTATSKNEFKVINKLENMHIITPNEIKKINLSTINQSNCQNKQNSHMKSQCVTTQLPYEDISKIINKHSSQNAILINEKYVIKDKSKKPKIVVKKIEICDEPVAGNIFRDNFLNLDLKKKNESNVTVTRDSYFVKKNQNIDITANEEYVNLNDKSDGKINYDFIQQKMKGEKLSRLVLSKQKTLKHSRMNNPYLATAQNITITHSNRPNINKLINNNEGSQERMDTIQMTCNDINTYNVTEKENSFDDNISNELNSSKVLFLKNNFKNMNKNKTNMRIFKISKNVTNSGHFLTKKEKNKETYPEGNINMYSKDKTRKKETMNDESLLDITEEKFLAKELQNKLAKFNLKFLKDNSKITSNLPDLNLNNKKKNNKLYLQSDSSKPNFEEFLNDKGKKYMNVILLTNNNVNIKGNNNVIISDTCKLKSKGFSKYIKRINTEKGNTNYKKEFEDISEYNDNNEIPFPVIIQSLMK